jgi:hypothetical protein
LPCLRQTIGEFIAESQSAAHDRGDTGLIDHVDVEVRQLLGRALHPLDRLVHVVVGKLLDRERDGGHVDAFRHRFVKLEHGARGDRGRKDHPDVQAPSGDAFSHACAPGAYEE